MKSDYYWVMDGDLAVLREKGKYPYPDVIYNRESLLYTIENVKKNRASYVTEDAYYSDLSKYLQGLGMLDSVNLKNQIPKPLAPC